MGVAKGFSLKLALTKITYLGLAIPLNGVAHSGPTYYKISLVSGSGFL